jgi:hypothetical protein
MDSRIRYRVKGCRLRHLKLKKMQYVLPLTMRWRLSNEARRSVFVDSSMLGDRIGVLSEEDMKNISKQLKIILGL